MGQVGALERENWARLYKNCDISSPRVNITIVFSTEYPLLHGWDLNNHTPLLYTFPHTIYIMFLSLRAVNRLVCDMREREWVCDITPCQVCVFTCLFVRWLSGHIFPDNCRRVCEWVCCVMCMLGKSWYNYIFGQWTHVWRSVIIVLLYKYLSLSSSICIAPTHYRFL